ncbi:MAG: DNA/RNA non-specific endonuclease [Bacteroidales bacterium]|jgi:endonuclease G|nr:DNA/RNA non-specific endonuclease [Bacteroidales bacterium]
MNKKQKRQHSGSNIKKQFVLLILLLGFGFLLVIAVTRYFTDKPNHFEFTETADNVPILKLEIPAKMEGRTEQIIEHLGYTVSYNQDWKIANWVAYELTREEVEGITPRGRHFVPDPDVLEKSAIDDDYRNSGWDRGHLAPAADMKWSVQAMNESFYFSNICPQNHNLNGGDWRILEEQVRNWASETRNLYVVCGPVVSHNPPTIGNNRVVIPTAFYKVLLKYELNTWSAIGFLFDNKSGHKPLHTYAKSVEEIQKITQIDFFPELPDEIEQKIEKQFDWNLWR